MIVIINTVTTVACTGPNKNTLGDRNFTEIIKIWTICEKQSKSIEVSYKNDDGETTLAKVHFRVPKTVIQDLLKSLSLLFILTRMSCQLRLKIR